MANDLTGDFDVVAEFAVLAVNRVLAAMHRAERFPHSMSIRVDDTLHLDDTPPHGPTGAIFSIVGRVDTFGDPIVDHTKIGTPIPVSGQLAATDPIFRGLDPVVNPELIGATLGPIVHSHLKGQAQLQLSPPTIEVGDASGANVTVRMRVMARYLPDPHTRRLAEFVRGQLQITAPVSQVTSQTANVIDIDLKVDHVNINFSPAWSITPLSAEDVAGINLLIRNALKTSFLPSTNPLPANINYMQFKTLLGAQSAIGVLLNMAGARGNPASMNNVFLGAGDAFALTAGRDFILAAFPEVRDHRVQHLPSAPYDISNTVQRLDLQDGQLLFTMTGHVHRTRWPRVDFDFTIKQALTLTPVATTAGGPLDTAELALLGDVSFEITGIPWPFGWIANQFTGSARHSIRAQRKAFLDQANPNVRNMLSIDRNLGGFLNSLVGRVRVVEPIDESIGFARSRPLRVSQVQLAYTSVEIKSAGIILHGSLAVLDWPPAHVEFQQIASTGGGRVGTGDLIAHGTDYSALRSWIPGGTIQQYEWSMQGQAQPFLIDVNKFVLIHAPSQVSGGTVSTGAVSGTVATGAVSGTVSTGAVSGFVPICLTVRGTRLSSSGPTVEQPVSATVCGYTRVSILEGVVSAPGGAIPMVALTQSGPGGLVEVAGHASATLAEAGSGTPNRIVHFAHERTAGSLGFLLQALRESKREDAATAVVAVMTPELLAKARYTEGVIYAEEPGGAWAGAFGVKTTRRPLTLIVGPKGNVVWQHEGELDSEKLAAALRKHLVSGGPVRLGMLGLSLRIGWPAPNFLFEFAPGRGVTLRKLEGRPVVLVFWKSSSKPSIETLRDLQEPTRKAGGQGPVVLAINDGEAVELAKRVAAENGLSATIVGDRQRSISLAYGVNIWPTIVFIDAFGLVRKIRYGRFAGENVEFPSRGKAASG